MVSAQQTIENIATNLANTDECFRDRAGQGIRKVVLLRHEVVNEIEFGRQALEEQVAICGVHVCFDINLRQVRLGPNVS